MLQKIQFEQWVPFPLEQVFLFFAAPQNLPRIMPRQSRSRIEQLKLVPPHPSPTGAPVAGLAGVGSEIHTSFRVFPLLPFRASWIALITEFEWNHHFADAQQKGPFKSFHHRHEFISQSRGDIVGTVIRDVIHYEVGFGWPGRVAESLLITRQLCKTFQYRQFALLSLLEPDTAK